MKAWLVVNAFLRREKFDEIYRWLYEAGKKRGVSFKVYTNQELLCLFSQGGLEVFPDTESVDFVLFWDKDIMLAKMLEEAGFKVYNSSHAIEVCDNKTLTHFYLAKENIPMPDTIAAPMTYANIGYTSTEFVKIVIEKLGLPLVIKESFGSFGQQVYLASTEKEVMEYVIKLAGKPFLFQKYIKASSGRDVRLQVVGKKVVAAMERRARQGDFRANVTIGGTMREYVPKQEEASLALLSCQILQVDFAGVDLLYDDSGKPMVCEVNSNAHFKNIADCTGVNAADYIVEYLLHHERTEKRRA